MIDPEASFTYKGLQGICAEISFSFRPIDFLKKLLASFQQAGIQKMGVSLHGGVVSQIIRKMPPHVNDLDIYIEIARPENPFSVQKGVFETMEKLGKIPPKQGSADPTIYYTIDGTAYRRPHSMFEQGGLKDFRLFKDALLFTFPCFVRDEPRDIDLLIAWDKEIVCFSSADSFHIDLQPWIEEESLCHFKTVGGHDLDCCLSFFEKFRFFLHSPDKKEEMEEGIQKAKKISRGLRIYISYLTKAFLPCLPQLEVAFIEKCYEEYQNEKAFLTDLEKYIPRHFKKNSFKEALFLYNFQEVLKASHHEKKEAFLAILHNLFDQSISSSIETRDFIRSALFWRFAVEINKSRLDDFPGASRYQILWQEASEGCLFAPLPLKETLLFLTLSSARKKETIANAAPFLKKISLPIQEDKLVEWLLKKIKENLPQLPFSKGIDCLLSKASPPSFLQKFLSLKHQLSSEELQCLTQLFSSFYPKVTYSLNSDLNSLVQYLQSLDFSEGQLLWPSLIQDKDLLLKYQIWLLSSSLNEENCLAFLKTAPTLENEELQDALMSALARASLDPFKRLLPLVLSSAQGPLEKCLQLSLKHKDAESILSLLKKMTENKTLLLPQAIDALKQLSKRENKDSQWLTYWEFLLAWSDQTDLAADPSWKIAGSKMLLLGGRENQKNFFHLLLKAHLHVDISLFFEKWSKIAQCLGAVKKGEKNDLISFLNENFSELKPWIKQELLDLISSATFTQLTPFIESLVLEELLTVSRRTESLLLSDPLQSFLLDRFCKESKNSACREYCFKVLAKEMPSPIAVHYLLKISAPWTSKEIQLGKKAVEAHLLPIETLWNKAAKENWADLIYLADFCRSYDLSLLSMESDFQKKIGSQPLPKDAALLSSLWHVCHLFSNPEIYALKIMEKAAILSESAESGELLFSLYLSLSPENKTLKIDIFLKSVKWLVPEKVPHEELVSLLLSHREHLASLSAPSVWPAIFFCSQFNLRIPELLTLADETLRRFKGPALFSSLSEFAQLLDHLDFYTGDAFLEMQTIALEIFYEHKAFDKGLPLFETLATLLLQNTKYHFSHEKKVVSELTQLLSVSLYKKPPHIPLSEQAQYVIGKFIDLFRDSLKGPSLQDQPVDLNHLIIIKDDKGNPISSQTLICKFFAALVAHKETEIYFIRHWIWIGNNYSFFESQDLIQIGKYLATSAKQSPYQEVFIAIRLFQTHLMRRIEALLETEQEENDETIAQCHSLLLTIYSSIQDIPSVISELDISGDQTLNLYIFMLHAKWLRLSCCSATAPKKIHYVQYGCELFSAVDRFCFISSNYIFMLFQELQIFCTQNINTKEQILVLALLDCIKKKDFKKEEKQDLILKIVIFLVSNENTSIFAHFWMIAAILLEKATKSQILQMESVIFLVDFLNRAQSFYKGHYSRANLPMEVAAVIGLFLEVTMERILIGVEKQISTRSTPLLQEELYLLDKCYRESLQIAKMLSETQNGVVLQIAFSYKKVVEQKLSIYQRL